MGNIAWMAMSYCPETEHLMHWYSREHLVFSSGPFIWNIPISVSQYFQEYNVQSRGDLTIQLWAVVD